MKMCMRLNDGGTSCNKTFVQSLFDTRKHCVTVVPVHCLMISIVHENMTLMVHVRKALCNMAVAVIYMNMKT